MSDEARIRVRIDTSQAKGDLRGLLHESEKASGRLSGQLRQSVGRGLGMFGLGAGIGAASVAAMSSTRSGVSDIAGDFLGLAGAQLNDFVLGNIDEGSRARIATKQRVQDIWKYSAGQLGRTPDGAKEWFDAEVARLTKEEEGRSILRKDPAFSIGGDAWKAVSDAIREGFAQVGRDLREAIFGAR